MRLSARKARQDLSADSLFRLRGARFDRLADSRAAGVEIPLGDALRSAFAMFSLKDPSLLAFDARRRDSNDNFRSIYGIQRVPCDSQMRSVLDPVDPAELRPLFQDVFRRLQRGKALEPFVYLEGHYLVSLDGTTYFSRRHSEESGVSPGAQLRPRRAAPVRGPDAAAEAGLPGGPDATTVLSGVPGRLEKAGHEAAALGEDSRMFSRVRVRLDDGLADGAGARHRAATAGVAGLLVDHR